MDFPSDEARFAAILAKSGMVVPPEQVPSLFEGYCHLLRLIAVLGGPARLETELALIFAPERR